MNKSILLVAIVLLSLIVMGEAVKPFNKPGKQAPFQHPRATVLPSLSFIFWMLYYYMTYIKYLYSFITRNVNDCVHSD
jgi:hypothetical protein